MFMKTFKVQLIALIEVQSLCLCIAREKNFYEKYSAHFDGTVRVFIRKEPSFERNSVTFRISKPKSVKYKAKPKCVWQRSVTTCTKLFENLPETPILKHISGKYIFSFVKRNGSKVTQLGPSEGVESWSVDTARNPLFLERIWFLVSGSPVADWLLVNKICSLV
jgi:hypothetical protein